MVTKQYIQCENLKKNYANLKRMSKIVKIIRWINDLRNILMFKNNIANKVLTFSINLLKKKYLYIKNTKNKLLDLDKCVYHNNCSYY